MKKTLLLFILFVAAAGSNSVLAQTPQGLNYQAIVRNSVGEAVSNQDVSLRISIRDGSATGTVVYSEVDTVPANQFGLITVVVGGGTIKQGSFTGISWGSGSKYMQVEIDVNGGTAFVDMGTTQLLSVPYALYAETAGNNQPGPAGPQGPQGVAGADGAIGPQGPQGVSGIDGLPGPEGPQGVSGNDGAIGPQGPQGVAGVDGLPGPQGIPGVTGPIGADGVVGPQGPQGVIGADGPTGAQGVQGVPGNDGSVGPQGPQGIAGIDGLPGPQGIQGLPGAAGLVGPTGVAGPQGPQGLPGIAGAVGIDGLDGLDGLDGPQGPTGPVGPRDSTLVRSGSEVYFKDISYIGVNTTTPEATLDVNGFTKLGGDAPKIKYKKYTATAPSIVGGATSVAIPIAKILSISVVVYDAAGAAIGPNNILAGYEYSYTISNSGVTLYTTITNSASVLSRPIAITIMYEE